MAAALEGSPGLASTAYEIRRREALAIQANLIPNPTLSLDVEDFIGPSQQKSYGYQQTTLSLAQLVELGGKRGARRRLADRDRDVATWDFETRRVAVLADTTKAFLFLLALQERQKLLQDLERIAAEMLRSVASTVRAGAVSPVEEDRAQVNLDRVRLDVAQVENDLEVARALLAASWGQSQASFDRATGDLWTLPPTPNESTLLAVVQESPELARWDAEIAQREAAVALERSARIPSVEVSLAGRHHELGNVGGVVAGITIPMPLFNRNQGNILAARQQIVRARAEQQQADVSVRSALASSFQAFVIASRQVETLRDQIIPRAGRVFEKTRKGYATGLFRYVEVLDAQRTLFGARRELLDAVLALHLAATDLERLTGTPLAQLSRSSDR
ncbi:TolC family protein [Myxococcota bacterium]|nr:TolC family protein [Myxococcota bacterium]